MEVTGDEKLVTLSQPFEDKWDATGLLRLSAAIRSVALTMKASE